MYLYRYKHTEQQKGSKGNYYPQHIISETINIQNKENALKASVEKLQVTYKGKPMRTTAELSLESLKVQRCRRNALHVQKEHR